MIMPYVMERYLCFVLFLLFLAESVVFHQKERYFVGLDIVSYAIMSTVLGVYCHLYGYIYIYIYMVYP